MIDEDGTTLEEQLCFALYDASRAVMGQYRAGLGDLGLTYTQYVVLLVLWTDDDITVSALGERLKLDSGTLSPLLKRLEAQGLVTRRRSDADERVVHVSLTDEGRAMQGKVNPVRCAVEDSLGISKEQIADLRARLQELSAHLRPADA